MKWNCKFVAAVSTTLSAHVHTSVAEIICPSGKTINHTHFHTPATHALAAMLGKKRLFDHHSNRS